MISCILMSLFVMVISLFLGGIPIIVFLIMLETGGLIDYVLAGTLAFASIFELVKFIYFLTSEKTLSFNIKEIFANIKSILKKEGKKNKEKNRAKTKNKTNNKVKIFELIFILLFVIIALFNKPHSILLDVIYDNLIVRILYYIFIPLVICDLINQYRDGIVNKLGEIFEGIMMSAGISLLFGIIISTSFIFTSNIMYKDVLEDKIKPLFVYENLKYDEIRSSKEFSNEYDFLKSSFINKLNELKAKYDVNDKNSYQNMKNILFRDTDIVSYGYTITDREWKDEDTVLICVVDKKTRNYNTYKLNLKNNVFELSSTDEFENIRKINYENK